MKALFRRLLELSELKKWFELPIGCTNMEPGSSLNNITAGWRVFTPVIDEKKCTKCYLCWAFCPENAIKIADDGFPKTDYRYCKGCGICSNECPAKAITMIRQEV
ncbi:MAG: 2-ketoisovalerate ferredoxin oxidoreductase [Thermoprotei archaeon]|nr:MAG: 2-ketoisovalerate ferredoxin oxidoreductase [Thermoprotei archaeon]